MIKDKDYFIGVFRTAGDGVPIVHSNGVETYGATAERFISSVTKLVYALWLLLYCLSDRKPVEVQQTGGLIASGTLALNFNSISSDIVAYVIRATKGDQVAAGSIQVTHTYVDTQGNTNTFVFSAEPVKESEMDGQILYLANVGVGAKYVPSVHRADFARAVAGGASVDTTNAFAITGPDNVRVEIKPLTSMSISVSSLASVLPFIIVSSIYNILIHVIKTGEMPKMDSGK